jgi:RES domain-containing protein
MTVPPLYYGIPGQRPDQPGGRWHRNGEGYAQYLAQAPAGAWAELVRQLTLRTTAQIATVHRTLWLGVVESSDIADLSTFDAWSACGLDPDIAVGDHAQSQRVGDDLRDAGYRGVLSPSAALPDTAAPNLTLFGPRIELMVEADNVHPRNPDPDLWCVTTLLADRAAPPLGLCTRTRFLGAKHLGLERWRARS